MKINEASDISSIKGVGEKKRDALGSIGINTVKDLLEFFPHDYRDRGIFKDYSECAEGDLCLVKAKYTGIAVGGYAKKGYSKSILTFEDGVDSFDVIFYNQPYISTSLKVNELYRLYGRFYKNKDKLVMISPQLERDDIAVYLNEGVYPIYSIPVKCGIKQKEFTGFISDALDKVHLDEDMPLWLNNDLALLSKEESLRLIHEPMSISEAYKGLRYFKTKEFISFYIKMNARRAHSRKDGIKLDISHVNKFNELLKFKLTNSQISSLKDVLRDMASGKQMNRLIQGDVGSGKTMISVMASYVVAANGMQAAICAPTEILAKQHYQKYSPYFEAHGYKCGILYSGMKKELRDKMQEAIKKGVVKVVFGTHALFSDNVEYQNLALITIDEQHRYGVAQRAALESKGFNPHVLVMSATPIPRTLALGIYKDLDVSVIDELPSGRKPIKTMVVGPSQTDKIYEYISKFAQKGLKSYIVCPAIDALDMENVSRVYTQAKEALAPNRVVFITGEMKEEEKNTVMQQFANGPTNILVATSIIEVGVDVPNAVIMWIRGAERFGLAQLHQLRGRVGRNNLQSYCFLQTDSSSEKSMQRLSVLKNSDNGFEIAKKDMQLRGSGEIFGFKQSGKSSEIIEDALAYPDLFMACDEISTKLKDSAKETDIKFYESLKVDSDKAYEQIAFN